MTRLLEKRMMIINTIAQLQQRSSTPVATSQVAADQDNISLETIKNSFENDACLQQTAVAGAAALDLV